MKKKFIVTLLLCTLSLSLLNCNNENKNTTNKKQQSKQEQQNKNSNEDENNINEKDEDEDDQINSTNEPTKNNTDTAQPLSSEKLVEKYEELRPKVTNLLKDKLETPNADKGEAYKVYEKSVKHDLAGYKGVESLSYDDGDNTLKHFTNATYGLCFDKETNKKATEITGHLMQVLTLDEIAQNGVKLQGTMFEEFMNLFTNEKIDFKSIQDEIKSNVKSTVEIKKKYGNTTFTFSRSGASLVCNVSIK